MTITNKQIRQAKLILGFIEKCQRYNEYELHLPANFFDSDEDRENVVYLLNFNRDHEQQRFDIDSENDLCWLKVKQEEHSA